MSSPAQFKAFIPNKSVKTFSGNVHNVTAAFNINKCDFLQSFVIVDRMKLFKINLIEKIRLPQRSVLLILNTLNP